MQPRIALLNAAQDPTGPRRNFRRELDAELVEFDASAGEVPETVAFDACLVTGSRASVYWDEPWIGTLKRWVGDAVEAGLPVLGVCFGHQLLADVLGGSVEPMDEYEIGYREVHTCADSVLFDGVGECCMVFTTHSDRVSRLPPGARLLAANDYGIHGFRKGRMFGVQFHPEYDPESALRVTRDKDDQLPAERIERVCTDITPENYEAACEAKQLFDSFTAFVREQSPRGERVAASADD